jgi:hypothetical protein
MRCPATPGSALENSESQCCKVHSAARSAVCAIGPPTRGRAAAYLSVRPEVAYRPPVGRGVVGIERVAGRESSLLGRRGPVLETHRLPNRGWVQRVTSPAAYTESAALRVASHATPSSRFRPESVSHSTAGSAPIPTATRSASSTAPSERCTSWVSLSVRRGEPDGQMVHPWKKVLTEYVGSPQTSMSGRRRSSSPKGAASCCLASWLPRQRGGCRHRRSSHAGWGHERDRTVRDGCFVCR